MLEAAYILSVNYKIMTKDSEFLLVTLNNLSAYFTKYVSKF